MKKQHLKQSVFCFTPLQRAFESRDQIYSRQMLLQATFPDPFPTGFSAVTLNLGRFSQGILQKSQHTLKEIQPRNSQMTEALFGEQTGERDQKTSCPTGTDPETTPSPDTSPLSPKLPSCGDMATARRERWWGESPSWPFTPRTSLCQEYSSSSY